MNRWKSPGKIILAALIITTWLAWDLNQAHRDIGEFPFSRPVSDFPGVVSSPATVSIVRSDDSSLDNPIPTDDASIEYTTIEAMVRKSVELAGGFEGKIESGDMVLLKPNIVDPEPPGSGEVTDVRVVKALIKIIDEIAPGNIEIVVGEGAPRPMDYEMVYQSRFSSPVWDKLWDTAGYQDLLTDENLSGINLRFSNLNGSPPDDPWQDLELVEVPGGGDALPQYGEYFIHKDVLNADFYITIPVMKIHTPGMTVALKNQIGLAPSTKYGFHKTTGVPQNDYSISLVHEDPPHYWTDKEIVDLSTLAGIDFAVVDAIACLERSKSAERSGGEITNLVRMNTIIASPDPVAADHVSARLMGLNPDDIEHITLAERRGLGTNNPEDITVAGSSIVETQIRFRKNSSSTAEYGQSNRVWLMKGPYDTEGIDEPTEHEFLSGEASLAPVAGQGGWSDPVYFTEDRLDVGYYYGSITDQAAYAFTYFTAPKTQDAELWIGSDDGLKIWLNGEVVYSFSSYRNFSSTKFYSEIIPVTINAGENRILVKTTQDYGGHVFSLNICEPEDNPYFRGNRVWGLKFTTKSTATGVYADGATSAPEEFALGNAYPNPFNGTVVIPYELHRPGQVSIRVYDIRGRLIRTLFHGNQTTIGHKQIKWAGRDNSGNRVSTGPYLIRVVGPDGRVSLQKVTHLK
ncbi:MAG: DUF362 domain-containing protein [Candidatus Marinimicrobia bacterium]|nr:DUF362 domain-containing protein [Candidatus Neomarinimicrobiota bacterium]MCF7827613.1 DUF362 domain-containing protein [Candidatus Neomarinimicrobiota bacterium]MCF7881332.1 DUF362 domain-containing protein [Candidatus Neomarinimicrobiota bacterium]